MADKFILPEMLIAKGEKMTEFYCDSKYLVLPINYHAKNKRIYFYVEGKLVYDLVAAIDTHEPDEKFYINMERFKGKNVKVAIEPEMEFSVELSDVGVDAETEYYGKYRPLAHFTAKRGWLNDPNGLVYYRGKYFMFYQHNPAACTWENMHWGSAVSDDLMHWKERTIALYPDTEGTMFSGSAIIDKENVTGLKKNDNDVILLFYTTAGSTSETSQNKPFTQCMAYSTDGGETFIKYDKNPLIEELVPGNRDPKVIYHKESKKYIMVFYLDNGEYVFYTSDNLLDWNEMQRITIPGEAECPDFFPLAVDGDINTQKWVLIGASDKYLIGDFDGGKFVQTVQTPLRLNYGNASYAAQSWSDMPDGRRVRVSCYSETVKGMPFGGYMSVPVEMSMKTIANKVRLCVSPVKEIERLYEESSELKDIYINENDKYEVGLKGKSYDISLKVRVKKNAVFQCAVFGLMLKFQEADGLLSCLDKEAYVSGEDGVLDIRIVIDTLCAEIYADKGSVFMGMSYIQDFSLNKILMLVEKASVKIEDLKIAKLNSFWEG